MKMTDTSPALFEEKYTWDTLLIKHQLLMIIHGSLHHTSGTLKQIIAHKGHMVYAVKMKRKHLHKHCLHLLAVVLVWQ